MDTKKPWWPLSVCLSAVLGVGCGVKVPPVQPVARWNGQSPWDKDVEQPMLVVLQAAQGARNPGYRIVGVDAKSKKISFIKQAGTLEELNLFVGHTPSNGVVYLPPEGAPQSFPFTKPMSVVSNPPPPPQPPGQEQLKDRFALGHDPTEALNGLQRAVLVILDKEEDVLRPMDGVMPGQQGGLEPDRAPRGATEGR